MNYLAHLFLSDGTPLSLVGNLMGDFVKGREVLRDLPEPVRRGVELHRRVDAFTDSHPAVRRAARRLNPRWGHWAGVILDVYFDHLLATRWGEYAPRPLTEFVSYAHASLWEHRRLMPPAMEEMVRCLVAHDRLRSYARLSGIADALARLSARIRARQPGRQVYLEGAIPDLREHHAALAAAFDVFFPELLRFARSDAAAPPRSRAPGIGWRKADEILPFGATPAPLRV